MGTCSVACSVHGNSPRQNDSCGLHDLKQYPYHRNIYNQEPYPRTTQRELVYSNPPHAQCLRKDCADSMYNTPNRIITFQSPDPMTHEKHDEIKFSNTEPIIKSSTVDDINDIQQKIITVKRQLKNERLRQEKIRMDQEMLKKKMEQQEKIQMIQKIFKDEYKNQIVEPSRNVNLFNQVNHG